MSQLQAVYQFGPGVRVEVWGDNVRTLISGLEVVAGDNGDGMQACIDHELAHSYLAWFYGLSYSPTLFRQGIERRYGDGRGRFAASDADVAYEEQIVLAFVRGLADGDRPWERCRIE